VPATITNLSNVIWGPLRRLIVTPSGSIYELIDIGGVKVATRIERAPIQDRERKEVPTRRCYASRRRLLILQSRAIGTTFVTEHYWIARRESPSNPHSCWSRSNGKF
jgi:hypothetical protein